MRAHETNPETSQVPYDHEGEKNSCWCDSCGGYHGGPCAPCLSRACTNKRHIECRDVEGICCDCNCHLEGGQ